MSCFEIAVQFVLRNEGGLSENVNDAGGITNFGISLRYLQLVPVERLRRYGIFEDVCEITIRNLTIDQAILIYKNEFWNGNNFENIDDQELCNYIFDMNVAHGHSQATKMIQRALCADYLDKDFIKDDGIFGSDTLCYVNEYDFELFPSLVAIRGEFYRHLAASRPKDEKNLEGWLNRCYTVD